MFGNNDISSTDLFIFFLVTGSFALGRLHPAVGSRVGEYRRC